MVNSQKKGARIERFFANELKPIFPDVRRTGFLQATNGGVDLENTPGFAFEVKGGKSYKSKMIRDIIDQTESEGNSYDLKVSLVKPEREEPYAMMPFSDFKLILKSMKAMTEVRK